MKDVIQIIKSMDTETIHLNPTEFYNEGWMIRLLVKKSIDEKKTIETINFADISNWTSEGLISSPFVSAPKYKEGYTHADVALGDFKIDYASRGEIIIENTAKLFGIFEAKMKSNLSQGTKYANDYNQASRNIACILSNTKETTRCFFGVVAPEKYLKKHQIDSQINKMTIYQQIKNRFDAYDDVFKNQNDAQDILNRINQLKILTISYESWIDVFQNEDRKELMDFYEKSKNWNRL